MNKLTLAFFIILLSVSPWAQSVRPVSVLVSATDSSGVPLGSLTKQNFSVLDNNGPATVMDARAVSGAPLSLGIVLLASKNNFAKEQAAAVDLINKLLRNENDHAFLITAGGEKVWKQADLQWQSDRDALIKEIHALDKNTGFPDAFNFELSTYKSESADSSASWGVETQQGNGVSVFDAVMAMMMADKRPARRVLVMFRDPWAHAPGLSLRNRDYTDKKHEKIITLAEQLHVAIYTIGFDEVSRTSNGGMTDIQSNYGMNNMAESSREEDRQIALEKDRQYSGGRANVERLASSTGGRSFWKEDHNFRDSVAGIVNELGAQYMLTFAPASATPGFHTLKVTSGQARVAAPAGFSVVAPATAGK